jgi:hypothetical protein
MPAGITGFRSARNADHISCISELLRCSTEVGLLVVPQLCEEVVNRAVRRVGLIKEPLRKWGASLVQQSRNSCPP